MFTMRRLIIVATAAALMTGCAQHAGPVRQRELMAGKVVSNLTQLAHHPELSAPMRSMIFCPADRFSSAGSANGRASANGSGSAARISTGLCPSAASRWLANFSVAARAAEISICGARAPGTAAVSTGSRVGPPSNASGQPWRKPSTACAARRSGDGGRLRGRTP